MITRPRLRSILIAVNLMVLIVPLFGISALRIYETELVRRTEAEVIAQAAFIKAEAERELGSVLESQGYESLPPGLGRPGQIKWPIDIDDRLRPLEPQLSSSRGPVLDPEPRPRPPQGAPNPFLMRVGERLEPTFVEAQKITLAGMNIVDVAGNVVATTNESQRQRSLYDREEVRGALDGEIVRLLRRRDARPVDSSLRSLSRETSVRVSVALPLLYEDQIVGVVTVWRTPQSLPKALYEDRMIFAVLVLVMLLAALVMAAVTSFYIGRPIQRLIVQTNRVTRDEGEGARPIENPGTYEVQQLSESIADMAKALAERADYIRTFARSVSHEFKTPLTSIRGTVELLQDYPEMTLEERERFLENLDKDARRLDQLVGRLLELARADLERPADASMDLLPLLRELAQSYNEKALVISLHLEENEESLVASITEEAIRSVLINLLVNARQHGGERVELEARRVEQGLRIEVRDDGSGVSAGNRAKIFDEFFTTARAEGGTGLGLSITRALLAAHGGSIELLPSKKGAHFRISLPDRSAGEKPKN